MTTEKTEPPELSEMDYRQIAASIAKIGTAARRMNDAGLKERAIVVLLQDQTGVSQRDIKKILAALPALPDVYLAKAIEAGKRPR